MIVDFHTHHFPDALAPRAISVLTKKTEGFLWSASDGTLATQLAHMAIDGVDKAVLCQIATKPAQYPFLMKHARAIRDGVYGRAAQEKIVPFLSVHPSDPELFAHLDEIAREGFKGVKFHPYYQDFKLDDPAVWPMFGKISDLGLVTVIHCGFDIGYPERRDACGPHETAKLLEAVPDLTLVAAHLGGCAGYEPHAVDRLIELGAYADCATLTRDMYRDEQLRLLRSWPTERLLFGTDHPWADATETLRWVKRFRDARDLGAILGGNAARLLGIGG